MVAAYETAYPRIKQNITPKELHRIYTPTTQEKRWSGQSRNEHSSRFSRLVYLKLFQRLGYFPKHCDIPIAIMLHISTYIGVTLSTENAYSLLPSEKNSQRIKDAIRTYCHIKKYNKESDASWLNNFADQMAETKESVIDIINAIIEILVKESYELPGFSTIHLIAQNARSRISKIIYDRIYSKLAAKTKKTLIQLLEENDGISLWMQVKQAPKKPTTKTIKRFIEHTLWLKSIKDSIGELHEIPEAKREQLLIEAMAYDRSRMKSIQVKKRLSLIALLVVNQYYSTIDCIIDMVIKKIRKLHNLARRDLKIFQSDSARQTESLVVLLKDVAIIMSDEDSHSNTVERIGSAMDSNPHDIINRCAAVISCGLNSQLPFLIRHYTAMIRNALLDALALLDIHQTKDGENLLACLRHILQYRRDNLLYTPVKAIDITDHSATSPVDWIGGKWHKVIFKEVNKQLKNRIMHHKYFELCVLSEITRRFQSGDLYVKNSIQHDDYRNHLISWREYNENIGEFACQIGIDKDPVVFTKALKADLIKQAQQADTTFSSDEYVAIVDGELMLRKKPKKVSDRAQDKFDQAINKHLNKTDILDLLVDTTHWVPMHTFFRPHSGHQSKIRDYDKRLVASLFCFGCNVGARQTARSITGLTRKQIASLKINYSTEKKLIGATDQVINTYQQYELPTYWGTGQSASVDGTKWDVYEQNLLSEYHIRYHGYGGIGYYMVSDKYIALFSRFIPCGVREAMHLIDGIIDNTSDIKPTKVHGDSHAQSTIVFALAHLLGIKLMPRIKNIKSLIFFNPDKQVKFDHIEELFSERINWELIQNNTRAMLRIVLSIKIGRVTASTIVRRLGTESIKNKLYYAFRELGRAVRTRFLLNYITDIDLRELIQAATCKSEEFNNFLQWVFFFNGGVIRENLRHDQAKIVKYNHLVANMIILHNVNSMTKAIRNLQQEGYPITPALLASLSPYRSAHINLLGTYQLNVNKRVKKAQYSLVQ